MRRRERIPVVMESLVSTTEILKRWLDEHTIEKGNDKLLVDKIQKESWKIFQYWSDNFDLTFQQVLLNLMFITSRQVNCPEAVDWLVDNNFLEKEDVTFWGTYGMKQELFDEKQRQLASTMPTYEDTTKTKKPEYRAKEFCELWTSWKAQSDRVFKKVFKPLSQLSTDHIEAIISRGGNIDHTILVLFNKILKERRNGIPK